MIVFGAIGGSLFGGLLGFWTVLILGATVDEAVHAGKMGSVVAAAIMVPIAFIIQQKRRR